MDGERRSSSGRRSQGGGGVPSRSRRSRPPEAQGGPWKRFVHDLRDLRSRFGKQTSVAHKRFVILLIVAGAVLRCWFAFLPITAEEAIAYMDFAAQPLGEVVSDYALPINHVFHTVLSKWSTGLFSLSVFTLRLPALLAGVLMLPLFYLFVRSMFNRYIALMALAMAAGSPCLMELSALAHGYSLTWMCVITAMCLGRHLVRENNVVSAVLLGVFCALGMWSTPVVITGVLMVFLWVLFSVLSKYHRSLGSRLSVLGLGFLVFIATTLLLYLPVIMAHGIDQLFHHASAEPHTWKEFSVGYAENVMALWVWIVDPVGIWMALIGFACLVQAAYISAKYRTIIIAMILGAVPVVMLLADAGVPAQWAYMIPFFHLGMAIALFYVLKSVQDKLLKNFGKRTRTALASLALLPLFALPGMQVVEERVPHLPEASACAELLQTRLAEGDGVCMDGDWEAPVELQLRIQGVDPASVHRTPVPGHTLYTVMEPNGVGFAATLMRCEQNVVLYDQPSLVKDWERMEIFAARLQ